MKTFSLLAAVLALGVTLASSDADAAKRLGAGKSAGMQRQAVTPDKSPAVSPPQAPAASVAAKAPAASAAAAAAPASRSSWMGPVAGLAAGLGLAALASHFGFGEQLASMLMIGLLVMVVVGVVAFVLRRRAAAQASASGGFDRMSYAAAGPGDAPMAKSFHEVAMPGSVSGSSGAQLAAGTPIPPDFDVAGFVRNAKVNFIRLQAANDTANLDDLRAFTTPEMFAEIRMNIVERGSVTQETDVVRIDADVVEVAEDDNRYVVSVRFFGLIREDANADEQAIDEIWHMTKPRDGSSGWVIAGIQQVQ